jgi:hypothetical protein
MGGRWAKEKKFRLSILVKLGCSIEELKDIAMNKRELIDCICEINRSAKPEFLANFTEEELNTYLEHLMELDVEELVVSC